MSEQAQRYVWYIAGPAACGKSTVGEALAKKLKGAFIEGDHLHSQKNREKMTNGGALTDAERAPWLKLMRSEPLSTLGGSRSKYHSETFPEGRSAPTHVVATCSALKRVYRDGLRGKDSPAQGVENWLSVDLSEVHVMFVFLNVPMALAEKRAKKREIVEKHFMKASNVKSQFDILEPIEPDEANCAVIDISEGDSPAVIKGKVEKAVDALIKKIEG